MESLDEFSNSKSINLIILLTYIFFICSELYNLDNLVKESCTMGRSAALAAEWAEMI